MTIASFNARLKKCNPRLRLRRRTGYIINKAEGFAPAGMFRGVNYLHMMTIVGDIPYVTRPTIWRIERVPGMSEPQKYLHARMRRGRTELADMLLDERFITRTHRQLLKI